MTIVADSSTPTSSNSPSTPPWNPTSIWRWGLLCGPYWASLMAGLNIVRLGQKRLTIWPVLIILAVLGFALVDPFLWYIQRPSLFSYFFQIAVNFAALYLLWVFELKGQQPVFDTRPQETRPAKFKIPVVLGLFPAIYLWAYILGYPFLLITSPKMVCDAYVASENWDEIRSYCTINMHPAIDLQEQLTLLERPDPNGITSRKPTYQLGNEVYDSANPQLCRVDVQYYLPGDQLGESSLLQGYFELVMVDRVWLIDELYFTHNNREPFPQGKVRMEDLLKAALESLRIEPPKGAIDDSNSAFEESPEVSPAFSTVISGAQETTPQFPDDQFDQEVENVAKNLLPSPNAVDSQGMFGHAQPDRLVNQNSNQNPNQKGVRHNRMYGIWLAAGLTALWGWLTNKPPEAVCKSSPAEPTSE